MVEAQPPNSVAVAPTRRATVGAGPSWRLARRLGRGVARRGALGTRGRARQPGARSARRSRRRAARDRRRRPASGCRSRRGARPARRCDRPGVRSPRWAAPGRGVISACQAPRRSFAHQTAIAFARACGCSEAIGIRKVWIVTSDRLFSSASSRRQCGQSGSLKIASAREPRPRTSLIASASGSALKSMRASVSLRSAVRSRCAFMSYRWPNRKYWPLAST